MIVTASALSALDGATGPVELRGATFKLKDPASFKEFEAHAQKQAGAALKGFTIDINDKALKQLTGPLAAVSSAATVAMWLIGLAGAAVLALLIALAVKQRRREYGVLLAMGERRWKLIAQQAAEIVAVAALAIGLSSLVAEPLTQRAGAAVLGTGAAAVAQGLPALAAILALGAVTSWWWLERRAGRCTCTADRSTACGCAQDVSSSKPDPADTRP